MIRLDIGKEVPQPSEELKNYRCIQCPYLIEGESLSIREDHILTERHTCTTQLHLYGEGR